MAATRRTIKHAAPCRDCRRLRGATHGSFREPSTEAAERDQLASASIDALSAAQDYESLWKTLETENRIEPVGKLEQAFGIGPLNAFFGIDDDGMLLSPNKTDILQHLVTLYEQFLLPRFSSFGNSPEFRQALRNAGQEFEGILDASKAIYSVFATAEPQNASVSKRLEIIRTQWQKTFIRDDLMQETMIQFNFERLSSTKRELSQLQSRFDRQTFLDLRNTGAAIQAIDDAEADLTNLGPDTTWILLNLQRKQSPL